MVGEKLRRERERQGLTLKDVEQGTSIRALYIEALEREDWATLPGDVYAKGFVRNVAAFLKLDADACVAEYVKDTAGADSSDAEGEGGNETQDAGTQNERDEQIVSDLRRHVEEKRKKQKALMAAMLLIVLGGAAYLMTSADDGKQATKVRPNENGIVTVTQEKDGKETPVAADKQTPKETADKQSPKDAAADKTAKPASAQTPAPAAKTSGVELTAAFNDRCWMKVVADGGVVYEGTAEKGNTLSWKGKERIAITAGNAGAVSFTHNGKNMGQAGAYGDVVNRTFTKEGAH